MRIGNVELVHNAVTNNFDFKINPLTEKEDILKVSINTDVFIKDHICEGADLSEEEIMEMSNKYFQGYQLEKDPYNPKLAERILEYLNTFPLEVVSPKEPAFPMGISLEWDPEKKKIVKNVYGLHEDLVKLIHAARDNDPVLEMVFALSDQERTERMKDVLAMEKAQAEKDAKTTGAKNMKTVD